MAEGRTSCGCKVGVAIDEYGLDGMDEELIERWTGPDGESVRTLTDAFNRRILAAGLADAGVDSLEPEVETTYRLLQDEDVSSGMRVTKRRQLERASVDVDRITSHFVSHQTLYRHLRTCLDQTADGTTTDPSETAIDDVEGLVHRTDAVVSDRIGRLASSGDLDHDEYGVHADIAITCDRCGEVYGFEDLLRRGGCGCGE